MDLLLVRLIFTIRLHTPLRDPNTLFFLKKPFEEAFRMTCRRGDGRCDGCADRSECPCRAVFGQELAQDKAVVKLHQKPPLPFVFQLPLLRAPLSEGEEFELGLVLVGMASGYVREFCDAVAGVFQAAGRGTLPTASIVKVETACCSGYRTLLRGEEGSGSLDPSGLSTISLEDLLAMNTLPSDRMTLRILTPILNLSEGRPVRGFSFSSFIRPLFRRISSLSRYYYGSSLNMDYKRLAALSESIAISEGGFFWIERSKAGPGGVLGGGTLQGELTEFHPALILGEYLHCGKGAAFGQGRYEIVRQ